MTQYKRAKFAIIVLFGILGGMAAGAVVAALVAAIGVSLK